MVIEVREFSTEGHRLLVEHALSPSELAAKAGLPRQRITEWRTGRARPGPDGRRALEAVGIPARAWDAAPTTRPKDPAPPPAPRPATTPDAKGGAPSPPIPQLDPAAVEAAPVAELEAFGVAGLEGVIARLRALAPELPPRERVQAISAEGRLHAVLAGLRAKAADARREYLDSPEFAQEMRLLAAAWPGSSAELRIRLGRMGVDLPAPPSEAHPVARKPPSSSADVERLLEELEVAAGFRAKGEPYLAAAHVTALALDVHADAIAQVLATHGELAGRFLAALDPADTKIVSAALERRMALEDIARLPPVARKVVAQLLEAHGLESVAAQVGGA